MNKLVRKNIQDVKPYEPGKSIQELSRELGIAEQTIIKLASNENPLGPSPKALKAIQKALTGINRYPDGSSFSLKRKLAEQLKLTPENIVLGNGSDELIDIITKAFLEKDEEVIVAEPAFLEYKIIAKINGAAIKAIPMKGPMINQAKDFSQRFFYNIPEILRGITRRTKLVFLGNPDNPTGAYFSKGELASFLKGCPSDVIIVFDEAYRAFVDEKDYANPIESIKARNVIILRTFSKDYGLAGLRIGYGITNKELARWMDRVRQPFNVNVLAQVAAEAALDDAAHITKTKQLIRKGRIFLINNLKELGCDVVLGPANFILLSYKGLAGTGLFQKLLPRGVIVRDMKPYGLSEWARVNVGTMPENERFIRMLRELLKEESAGNRKRR